MREGNKSVRNLLSIGICIIIRLIYIPNVSLWPSGYDTLAKNAGLLYGFESRAAALNCCGLFISSEIWVSRLFFAERLPITKDQKLIIRSSARRSISLMGAIKWPDCNMPLTTQWGSISDQDQDYCQSVL